MLTNTSGLFTVLLRFVVYYRGVLPSPLRKKLLERAHQKSKKSKDKDRSSTSDIITGQQVSLTTLQEEILHWNLNLVISLMANSLYFNSAYYFILGNFSMIACIIEIQIQNLRTSNPVNLTDHSQVAKLNSAFSFIL